jgi:predicted dienelactone hydrolase
MNDRIWLESPARRRLLLAGLLVAGAPAWSSEAAPAYDIIDLDKIDASRKREVPLRLYLPHAAGATQPVPLVVFSHGIGGSRFGYSWLGSHLAGAGIASLHLQHVGSDRALWRGNPLQIVNRLQGAAQEAEAIARVQDLRFALDQVLADARLGPRLDAQRIVAAGHSYGANTTLLAAGARIEREGRSVDLSDARIRAAIVLSAPPFYGEAAPQKILSSIQVPTLHVTTTEDIIRIPGYWSGPEDRVAEFEATGGPRKLLAVFQGGSHSIFTDRAGPGGPVLNPQIKAATRELATAFVRSVFEGDAVALPGWLGRFSSLVARHAGIGS